MKKNRKFLGALFNTRFFPFLLLLLAFLTYGILIPYLGFYWDDFPYIWFNHVGGSRGVYQAVAEDRPVLGVVYAIILPLIGENPLAWQIFAIITHWLCAVCIFAIIKEIWPKHENTACYMSALCLIFPGFSQHWIAVIYSQAFLLFSIYYCSIFLMIQAIKNQHRYWLFSLASIGLSLFSMACSEYTVGLELLRPVVIFIVLNTMEPKKSTKQKLYISLVKWVPYFVSLVVFIIYRTFIATSVLYSVRIVDDLFNNPIGLIINFIKFSINNLIKAGILAWVKPFTLLLDLNLARMVDKIYLLILITVIFLFCIAIKIANKPKAQETNKEVHQWAKIAILLGILVIFFSGIPFFAVQYQLKLSFPYDRLSLPMILGSCLLIIGACTLIFSNSMTRKIFLSIVIGFSIGAQFLNANAYREDWDNLREFFWQLQWRVPDMEKETMLLTDKLPLNYYSDNSLSAPLNWIYEKPIENGQMPYILNFLSVRLGNRIPNLEPNTSIDQYYRIVNFMGNTSNSLVLQYAPPGCVHILDPELDKYNPSLSTELSAAIHLTNFERILNKNQDKENNLPRFLGSEPAHNWCYYYEKAALLQQLKKWNEIVILGETAFSLKDYPNDPIERFPFIEAYAHNGDYPRALELSKKTIEISPKYSKMLCALWERIKEAPNIQSFPEELMEFLSTDSQCEWTRK